MEHDWQPRDAAPYDALVMVWWLPINDNPYAESWTIGSRVFHEGEPLQTEQGEAKTDNWWISGRYYEPRHVSHWRRLPVPPMSRSAETLRIALMRGGLSAREA